MINKIRYKDGQKSKIFGPGSCKTNILKNSDNNISVHLEKTDQGFYPNYFLCQWLSYY